MEKTLKQLIADFRSFADCEEYISANGKRCLCTCGGMKYFYLLCSELGITARWTGDFSHEASGDGFELEFCEGDIILSLNN